jgi:hypothetical protein
MAVAVPPWLTGRHLTSVTARWQVADSAGVLGNGTGGIQTLTTLLQEIDLNGETQTSNIVAVNSTRQNAVPYMIDDSFTLTEIMRSYQNLNLLPALYMNADGATVVLATFVRGGNSWTSYMEMVDLVESHRKPQCTCQLVVRMKSIHDSITGAPLPNPVYGT